MPAESVGCISPPADADCPPTQCHTPCIHGPCQAEYHLWFHKHNLNNNQINSRLSPSISLSSPSLPLDG
jgi:hypothetical protein